MCCSQHSVIHQKPPALRLPVPSATRSCQGAPTLQGTHAHRKLCPSLSLSNSFSWACLVCPAASQAQPRGVQLGGHSGDIERMCQAASFPCLGGLRSVIPGTTSSPQLKEILGTQWSQLSARMQMEAEAFLGQHPAPGEEFVLMQSSLEMRP